MDKKSQIQVLGRTHPLVPLQPEQAERCTHDYLAAHSGRSRSALAKEQQSLQDLYDDTCAELACAFAPDLVAYPQASVEDPVARYQELYLFESHCKKLLCNGVVAPLPVWTIA